MLFEEDMKMRAQSKHLFFRNLIVFLIACFVILQCKFPMASGNFTSSDASMSPPGSRAQSIFESGSVIFTFTLSDVNMSPQGSRRQQLFSESPGGTQRTNSYSSLLLSISIYFIDNIAPKKHMSAVGFRSDIILLSIAFIDSFTAFH